MNLINLFRNKSINILQDDYILLNELKKRAENGTHRDREYFLLAKDYLESIHSYNIGNTDSVYKSDY